MVQMQTYLKVADNTGAKAVSYTHLDVYKRQAAHWAKHRR